ncbi:MAG: PEP-CTERM sorting domain-containing protein [Planctomycetota bacterium]
MTQTRPTAALALATLAICAALCTTATALSIYDVQYVDLAVDPAGNSPYDGQVIDCDGGIVVHKFPGWKPKLTLQDPSHPDGWGGIAIKDWTAGKDLFNAVAVGDRVSFTGVTVEEYRGNTLLRFEPGSGYTVASHGNPLPPVRSVGLNEIAAPVETAGGDWLVTDHSAEPYEAMRLRIADVTVTAMDLGKAEDNYNLHGAGDVWAADYMNVDAVGDYHPLVSTGQHFDRVTGILEQYTKLNYGWDYYQLLTTNSDDLVVNAVVPEPTALALVLAGLAFLRRRR